MSYYNTITWEIIPLSLPHIKRTCPKCGHHSIYRNSKKFRVNANKKSLDIWLIYHCEKCKSTYNLTIFERIHPKTMKPETLDQFMTNNISLIRSYAFNKDIHLQNKVSLQIENLPFEVLGDSLDFDIPTDLIIKCPYSLGLRIDKVLSQKLGVSRDTIKKLYKTQNLLTSNNDKTLRTKIKSESIIHYRNR